MKIKDYRKKLNEKDLKFTKHRSMILGILDNASKPLSAEEIFLKMKEEGSTVSLSTIYRTMETLEGNGIVIKTVFMDDSCSRYEYNRMKHKHLLFCIGCNKVISIESCPVEEYAISLCSQENFAPVGHRLEIYGICPDCKNKRQISIQSGNKPNTNT